jgi:hypothetical protein
MVKPTKEQALEMLLRLKNRNMPSSVKYFTIGFVRIALRKNFISVDDLVEEFPELDKPVQFNVNDFARDTKGTQRSVPKERR